MLLCDDALLLLTDPESGAKLVVGNQLNFVLAGAVLADLTLSGHVRISEKGERVRKNRVEADPSLPPPADAVLADAFHLVASQESWPSVRLVNRVARRLSATVYRRLVEAEVLREEEHYVLGLFRVRRYLPVTGEPRYRLLAALDQVLLYGSPPDDQTGALIGLLLASGRLVKVMDRGRGIDKRRVKAQAKQLLATFWPAKAAHQAIQAAAAGAAAASS